VCAKFKFKTACKKRPTPRAPDKCGRGPHFRDSAPNGGFGVWWFCPPNPALAGNASRWAASPQFSRVDGQGII